jgi:hypothetical protein
MKRAVRSILLGQLCLYVGLVICVILKPDGLSVNDGTSYFGIYRETLLPYAFGLLGAAYFATRARTQLPPNATPLQQALKVYALLIVGIVATPYAVGKWVDYLHIAFGSALFSLQLLLSCWLIWQLHYMWWSVALTLIELASGIAALRYLRPAHGLLIQSQVIFQLAFGVLLVLSLQRLEVGHHTAVAAREVDV